LVDVELLLQKDRSGETGEVEGKTLRKLSHLLCCGLAMAGIACAVGMYMVVNKMQRSSWN
jgi:hypothetical protein